MVRPMQALEDPPELILEEARVDIENGPPTFLQGLFLERMEELLVAIENGVSHVRSHLCLSEKFVTQPLRPRV